MAGETKPIKVAVAATAQCADGEHHRVELGAQLVHGQVEADLDASHRAGDGSPDRSLMPSRVRQTLSQAGHSGHSQCGDLGSGSRGTETESPQRVVPSSPGIRVLGTA